tara:strand:- start:27 stop:449 length:423 start_codon:yes stop_codon:yes gene_type:complete
MSTTNQATIVTSECVPACVDSDDAHHFLSTTHQCVEKLKYSQSIAKTISIPQASGTGLNFATSDKSNIYTSSGSGTIVLPNYPEGSILTVNVNQTGEAASYKIKVGQLDIYTHDVSIKSGTVQGIISRINNGKLAFVPIA